MSHSFMERFHGRTNKTTKNGPMDLEKLEVNPILKHDNIVFLANQGKQNAQNANEISQSSFSSKKSAFSLHCKLMTESQKQQDDIRGKYARQYRQSTNVMTEKPTRPKMLPLKLKLQHLKNNSDIGYKKLESLKLNTEGSGQKKPTLPKNRQKQNEIILQENRSNEYRQHYGGLFGMKFQKDIVQALQDMRVFQEKIINKPSSKSTSGQYR